MRFIAVAGVLACCCVAVPAAAQSTFANVRVEGLPKVFVTDRAGHETEGTLLKLTDSAIELQLKDTTKTFDPTEVSLIERKGDSLKNGTIIGLVVGSVAGALAGGMGDCPASGGGCVGTRIGMTLVAVGFYTAIGAGIDAAFTGRTRIWPGKPSDKAGGLTFSISPHTRRAFIAWRVR